MELQYLDYTSQARKRYTDLFKNDEAFDAVITTITEVLNDYQREIIQLKKQVLNIDLQQGYGLDFIGEIIKQKRLLTEFNQAIHFGFKDSYMSDTFGTLANPDVGGEWFSLLDTNQGSGRLLTDEEYRRVIRARIISNNTKCRPDEFMKIVDLLSYSTQNTVEWDKHGVIKLNIVEDKKGLLNYFISKIGTQDNILPIPLGYRLEQRVITP